MKILVTGAAGFIGYHTVRYLAERGDEVVGLDNINDYYDPELKYSRLAHTGIQKNKIEYNEIIESDYYPNYHFVNLDLENRQGLQELFDKEKFDRVCNLAAQAGVRYSIENPYAYIDSNIVGFINLLECCRHNFVGHFVYASSSSVYGLNSKVPYSETDKVDQPVSLYAATKKANELMAHVYSKLYGIPTTGLRFFTVYGPWGRPDMAPMLFTKSILKGEAIKVFNKGDLYRDFTYIDDIVEGLIRVIDHIPTTEIPYEIYNIGCSNPVKLLDFIQILEETLGKKAILQMHSMQAGDVYQTYADTTSLEKKFDYKPAISLNLGIKKFINWYMTEYSLLRDKF